MGGHLCDRTTIREYTSEVGERALRQFTDVRGACVGFWSAITGVSSNEHCDVAASIHRASFTNIGEHRDPTRGARREEVGVRRLRQRRHGACRDDRPSCSHRVAFAVRQTEYPRRHRPGIVASVLFTACRNRRDASSDTEST